MIEAPLLKRRKNSIEIRPRRKWSCRRGCVCRTWITAKATLILLTLLHGSRIPGGKSLLEQADGGARNPSTAGNVEHGSGLHDSTAHDQGIDIGADVVRLPRVAFHGPTEEA
jgi:hypothetical protein